MARSIGNILRAAAATLVVACATAGCKNVVPLQTPFMESVGDVDMSARELRVRVVEFGRRFSAHVEQAADEIVAQTDDEAVRRNALRWKSQAIPAAQEAVLQIDPLMALVDVWAFALQMQAYFESGPGASDFGAHQAVATSTSARIVDEVVALARLISVSGDISAPAQEIQSWVDNHPIQEALLLRDSVIGSGANLLGDQRGAFALVGDMNSTAREMAYRLAFYNEYLLKEVQWAAELMTSEMMESLPVDSMMSGSLAALSASTALMSELPGFVEGERVELIQALARERVAALREIDRQRRAVLASLQGEREIVLSTLIAERMAVLDAIRAEREATVAAMQEMFAEAQSDSRALVDHAVWRMGQLMLVLMLGAFVLGAVLILLWRFRVRS